MSIARRSFLRLMSAVAAGASGLAALGPMSSLARDRGADTEKSGAELVTPPTVAAIKKGLEFLATHQRDDGSLGAGYGQNVAVCGLSGLAFIASGSTPGRGPHGRQVDRCLNYILSNAAESGFIDVPAAASHGPMYGHGFATLFLAECYGMTLRADIREKLSKAVQLIVSVQNDDGGWRYQPVRHEADISVTVCEVMALRAARNAGLFVPRETMTRSIDYVKHCQNEDGGFMYQRPSGLSAFPRSAAAVVALYSAGVYEGPEIDKGLEYLAAQMPRGDELSQEGHFFYGHYYAVQAMWHAGGAYWTRWYPAIRDSLLRRQADDGSWSDAIGVEYATSMATIILQMPNNYLPIFQR